jgi:hypothetical protein
MKLCIVVIIIIIIIIIIPGLFNGVVNCSNYIPVASNDRMINELERMWKETAMA